MECEVFALSRYATAVLADCPIGYYRLDNTSGTSASDLSGNAYTGTINGTVTYSTPGALKNDPDSALTFDGSTAYIALPSGLTQGIVGSWECWFNLANTTFSTNPRPLANDNVGSTHNGVELGVDASAAGVFANLGYGSANAQVAYTTTLTVGTWYHFVVTHNGTVSILYLNGSNVNQVSNAHNLTAGADSYNIGRNPAYSGDYFPGVLDEVAFYAYALTSTQVSNHYTIGSTVITSSTQYDLSVFKEQQILVYDNNGNFIDCIRDAPLLSGFKETINGVTSPLKVQLPRNFEQIDLLGTPTGHGTMTQGYIWRYYLFGPGLPLGGLLRYQGIVDAYEPQIADSGQETIAVTLTPQGSALADHGLTGTLNFGTAGQSGTYVDPITQFNYFFSNTDPVTNVSFCHPLTLDSSNPTSSGVTTQFSYVNQTIQSIFDNVILMLPANYFYRTNPDLTVTLNQTPLTAQHTLQIGVHCSNPQYSQSWVQTQTAVYFVGGTNPATVTSTFAGSPITAIERGYDMTTLGERLYFDNESRVTDQVTANTLALSYLAYYDRPLLVTKIRVPDFRGPNPSVGYDIETLKVGDSIQIQDNTYNGTSTLWDASLWDTGVWDQSPGPALNVVVPIVSISYGFHFCDIEVGIPQPSLNRAVFNIQQKLQDFTVI